MVEITDQWEQIEAEYITTKISYRDLAEKYGISASTLMKRGTKYKWADKRKRYRQSVVTKAASKARNKESSKLANLQRAADGMGEVIAGILKDTQQFNRHIVQTRDGDIWDAEERVYKKFDTKAIRDITTSIKELTTAVRNLYGLLTEPERSAMDIAVARLALDQRKAAESNDDYSSGVIILPERDDSPEPDGGDQ